MFCHFFRTQVLPIKLCDHHFPFFTIIHNIDWFIKVKSRYCVTNFTSEKLNGKVVCVFHQLDFVLL